MGLHVGTGQLPRPRLWSLHAEGMRCSITDRPDVFPSKVSPPRPIDGSHTAARHAGMTNDERAAKLSDLHMIVLGRIAHLASADVDDIAGWLGVPVEVPAAVCADLEAAGLVTPATGH
jgi:hypothetical protein